jgi:hypothetical protein
LEELGLQAEKMDNGETVTPFSTSLHSGANIASKRHVVKPEPSPQRGVNLKKTLREGFAAFCHVF